MVNNIKYTDYNCICQAFSSQYVLLLLLREKLMKVQYENIEVVQIEMIDTVPEEHKISIAIARGK